MSERLKQTSIAICELVMNHHREGKTQQEIAKIIKRSRTTVQYIIKRWKDEKRVANKFQTRNTKKLSIREEQWILRKVKIDPKISALKLAI